MLLALIRVSVRFAEMPEGPGGPGGPCNTRIEDPDLISVLSQCSGNRAYK